MLSEKVKLAKSGDKEALTYILEQISPKLWSVSRNWRFNHWDREYAVQESLTNICDNLIELIQDKCFPLWCRRILESTCNNMYKREKMRRSHTLLKGDEEGLAKSCPTMNDAETLEYYLSFMSKEMAETFKLRYANDYSIKAIAQLQKIPEGTVSSRLYRGKQLCLRNYHLYQGD